MSRLGVRGRGRGRGRACRAWLPEALMPQRELTLTLTIVLAPTLQACRAGLPGALLSRREPALSLTLPLTLALTL